MKKDITGIILCGGKSSRMLTNKALLKLKDKTVIEIVLSEMNKVFSEVILSANEFNDFSFLNIPDHKRYSSISWTFKWDIFRSQGIQNEKKLYYYM